MAGRNSAHSDSQSLHKATSQKVNDLVPLQILFFGFLWYRCKCLSMYMYFILKLYLFKMKINKIDLSMENKMHTDKNCIQIWYLECRVFYMYFVCLIYLIPSFSITQKCFMDHTPLDSCKVSLKYVYKSLFFLIHKCLPLKKKNTSFFLFSVFWPSHCFRRHIIEF